MAQVRTSIMPKTAVHLMTLIQQIYELLKWEIMRVEVNRTVTFALHPLHKIAKSI
jgi:hypothetical protein